MSNQNNLGNKLGPRLADLMGKAVVSTNQRLLPQKVAGGMQLQDRFFRLVAGEAMHTVSGFTRRLAAQPETPDWARQTFTFMANGTGQWAALLNFGVYGSGLSSGIGGLLANELAPLAQSLYRKDPNALIAAPGAASLVARGIWSFDTGAREAGGAAISRNRFQAMVNSSFLYPDIGALLEMFRRGNIGFGSLATALERQGIARDWATQLSRLARVLLTPEQLADMVDRGILGLSAARKTAADSGVIPDDFDRMVAAVGQPPAIQDLLAGRRRGLISENDLEKGIRQSPIKSTWIPFLKRLQWVPLDTLQAADAVLQGHMSMAAGKRLAEDNGTKPDDFEVLVESAGRPPGIEDMFELLNRGEINVSQARQALLESPLKNKWVDTILKMRRKIPPQEQVRMMIREGVISNREGIQKLMQLGYDRNDAEAFARLASNDKTVEERDLTKSEIVNLYRLKGLTKTRTESMLGDMGYSDGEVALIVSLADLTAQKQERDAALTVIRTKYVAHKISDTEAAGAIDALHVPANMRDHLMVIWQLERDANVVTLTPAQIIAAVKRELIDVAEAFDRLVRHGYLDGDAHLLLAINGLE